MSHRPLDLSSLPPEIRRAVEQQLSKLPPQAREKLLREGSPLVEKMIARLGAGGAPPPLPAGARAAQQKLQQAARGATAAAGRASEVAERFRRIAPKGHYNATIRPGDSFGGGRFLMVVIAVVVLVATFWR